MTLSQAVLAAEKEKLRLEKELADESNRLEALNEKVPQLDLGPWVLGSLGHAPLCLVWVKYMKVRQDAIAHCVTWELCHG